MGLEINSNVRTISFQGIKKDNKTNNKTNETFSAGVMTDVFTPSTQSKNVEVKKNKGLFNKIRSLFTGIDYYKTSTGIKIRTKRNTGEVFESKDGTVFIDGAQDTKVKGTKKDDKIHVSSSEVEFIKTKNGNDTITVENSMVKNIYGAKGEDTIIVYNSKVDLIHGGKGKDNIYTEDSTIGEINGSWGKDQIETNGGYIEKINSSLLDDVTIKDNPLNPNPNDEYSFE